MDRAGDVDPVVATRIVRRGSFRARCERVLRSKELGLVVALLAAALVFTL
jgi:hypothetical protein